MTSLLADSWSPNRDWVLRFYRSSTYQFKICKARELVMSLLRVANLITLTRLISSSLHFSLALRLRLFPTLPDLAITLLRKERLRLRTLHV